MASPFSPTSVLQPAVIDDLLSRTIPETLRAAADSAASLAVVGDRESSLAGPRYSFRRGHRFKKCNS
jgi:hypothetical protein